MSTESELRAHAIALLGASAAAAPDSPAALAQVHASLEAVETSARALALDAIAGLADIIAAVVEELVLESVADREAAWADVVAAVRRLVQHVTHGIPLNVRTLPPRFHQSHGGPDTVVPDSDAARPATSEADAGAGDEELVGEFVAEAGEHLNAAELHLLTLETSPGDGEAVNALFRAYHSIKGLAGVLGLTGIQTLAHAAENLLNSARKGDLDLRGVILDLAFDVTEGLRGLIAQVSAALKLSRDIPFAVGRDDLVERLRRALEQESGEAQAPPVPVAKPPNKRLGDLLIEAGAATQADIDEAIRALERPVESARIGEILAQYNYATSVQIRRALAIQQSKPGGGRLGDILVELGVIDAKALEEALQKQQLGTLTPRLGEMLVRLGKVSAREVAQALRRQQGIEAQRTVRVGSDRLTALARSTAAARAALQRTQEALPKRLNKRASSALADLVEGLDQAAALATQLYWTPLNGLFQRMHRVARDTARTVNKPIDFTTTGESVVVPRNLADGLADPLLHLLRNAIDHGIESSTDERVHLGKAPTGHVQLTAEAGHGFIRIAVVDDGRGLDRAAIRNTAERLGLLEPGAECPDDALWRFLFEPGFSTAKQVSTLSGRGVGLDVVHRDVTGLGGELNVDSVPGQGSRFELRLPVPEDIPAP